MKVIDWKEINPTYFEQFFYYVIGKHEFRNRQWFGKGGGDRGRDILAYTYEELPFNLGYERKWIFQCKRWKRYPTTNQILNEISTASQHNPDFWVMVIPLNPTADQIDFLDRMNNNYPFKILILPLVAIQEMLNTYPEAKNILINGDINEGGFN